MDGAILTHALSFGGDKPSQISYLGRAKSVEDLSEAQQKLRDHSDISRKRKLACRPIEVSAFGKCCPRYDCNEVSKDCRDCQK
jgi:hypothetical protein